MNRAENKINNKSVLQIVTMISGRLRQTSAQLVDDLQD